jgi:tryptophan synthase alpha chain
MSRIKNIFQGLKKQGQKAFIPFITAGDSGLDNTFELMQTLVANGADVIVIECLNFLLIFLKIPLNSS